MQTFAPKAKLTEKFFVKQNRNKKRNYMGNKQNNKHHTTTTKSIEWRSLTSNRDNFAFYQLQSEIVHCQFTHFFTTHIEWTDSIEKKNTYVCMHVCSLWGDRASEFWVRQNYVAYVHVFHTYHMQVHMYIHTYLCICKV